MAEKVEINVIANDLASAALELVKNKLMDIGGTTALVGSAALMMGTAIVTGLNAAKDAAMEYDQQVYEMMLRTGGTAEETSRLIQVVDDAGVSYGTLQTAMKFAVKNGIEPNIESLANLSDEYLSLAPGVERGQFLLDKFGKSGMDMARAMELGGDALREMNNNVEGGLVLTQEAIDQSEEYRKNVDALSDSWQGFKVSIGNDVIPVLNDLSDAIRNEIEQNGIWKTGPIDVARALWENRDAEEAVTVAVNDHGDALNDLSYSLEAEAEAVKASTEANRGLLSLTMDIQRELDGYNAGMEDLNQQHDDLISKLAELNAKGQQNTKVWNDTSAALKNNEAAMASLEAEHSKAMAGIVANLYIAKLETDGFTDEEYAMGIQALVSAGQIDEATARMAVDMDENVKRAIAAKDAVVSIGSAAEGIAGDYFMNFFGSLTITGAGTQGNFGSGGVVATPQADGGPVQSNSLYLVGEEGPEFFVPNTSGTIIPNDKTMTMMGGGSGGGNFILNLTYAPAFSTADRNELLTNLRPMLDEWYRRRLTA